MDEFVLKHLKFKGFSAFRKRVYNHRCPAAIANE